MTEKKRDEFHRLRTGYLRLRSALRDPISGLFAFPLYFDEIRGLLGERNRIGALWVSLGDRRVVEAVYGWEAYDQQVAAAARWLAAARGRLFPANAVLGAAAVHADAFTLFVPGDADGRELDSTKLSLLALELEDGLEAELSRHASASAPGPAGVRVGAALLTDNPFHRFERRVYLALDEARGTAERPRDSEHIAWLAELQRVLRERDVRPVFQPVVDLNDGHTVALEAYARGPADSVFRLPRVMFSVGQQAGFGIDLDRLCHRLAIEAIAADNAPALLFLNTTVEYLVDSEWCSEGTLAALARAGLAPDRIVLEVAESQLTADPSSYRDALQPIRSLGYKLSLDDVGSSARSALLVDRLRPEFLKFDLTLVRGLAQDQLRRELVRSLVRLAARAGARLVAERVETEAERVALLECGASWGQGYFFAGETSNGAAGRPPGDHA